VLAHELMHSLVAKRYNIPVHSITLFILGGIAQITEEPKKPRIEFMVALAGPLMSITLGLIFGILWLALPLHAEIAIAVSFWLAWINLLLGVFNLIPGFPMDGGRILRSLIWWRTKNLDRATYAASKVGQGIGLIFMIGGVSIIFSGMIFNGIWISIIGWFIFNAATSSYQQLSFQQILEGHKVKEVMFTGTRSVAPEMSVDELVNDHIFTSGQRFFSVTDQGKLKGLVTLQDVKALPRKEWAKTSVGQIMTPLDKLQTVGPHDELVTAFRVLTQQNINQLPVVSDGYLVGMIARDNLLAFISLQESRA